MIHFTLHSTTWVAATFLLTGSTAYAFPVHRRLFQATFQQNVRCELCHSLGGSTERNPYGQAWQKAGESRAAFAAISTHDSDGDGFSNEAELAGGSNPGDDRSTPNHPRKYWQRAQTIPIPTTQLELVFDHIDRIEAVEFELSPDQRKKLATHLGRPLTEEEPYPTAYFGVTRERRTVVAFFSHQKHTDGRYSLLVALDTQGRFKKAAIFRAGADDGGKYVRYLRCLVGHKRDELPLAGHADCPKIDGGPSQGTIKVREAVNSVLWTAATLFST